MKVMVIAGLAWLVSITTLGALLALECWGPRPAAVPERRVRGGGVGAGGCEVDDEIRVVVLLRAGLHPESPEAEGVVAEEMARLLVSSGPVRYLGLASLPVRHLPQGTRAHVYACNVESVGASA